MYPQDIVFFIQMRKSHHMFSSNFRRVDAPAHQDLSLTGTRPACVCHDAAAVAWRIDQSEKAPLESQAVRQVSAVFSRVTVNLNAIQV
jgi:hypothetical protein